MTKMIRQPRRTQPNPELPTPAPLASASQEPIPIPDHDPLMAYLLSIGGPVAIDGLDLDSPSVKHLREAGVHLVVPLISQGELIGTLNLGPRLSDQPYSGDDRRLLAGLAAQVSPAIRVAQLLRQQEREAKERERIDQELRVAALIQQTLLPKDLPAHTGWEIDAFYRPARAVGGDFYDFISLTHGRLGLVIGDVTDKGVPAALVMATTRAVLRAAADRHDDPGQLLAHANNILYADIPPGMFVTCLYGILEPASGRLRFANAGHNLPYLRNAAGVVELEAKGMPLGLMPNMTYEVVEFQLEAGVTMVLTSDGIVEAHDPLGDMFGFGRLKDVVRSHPGGPGMIGTVIDALDGFNSAEQEDDVTMVVLRRLPSAQESAAAFDRPEELATFTVASYDGNEREAMGRVAAAVAPLGLAPERLERLKTAVAEAVMNAIEHGNRSDPAKPVEITVAADPERVIVKVRDQGGGSGIPAAQTPDLDAKLAGLQTPRGWGLFLIQQMVDELHTETDDVHHTMELVLFRESDK